VRVDERVDDEADAEAGRLLMSDDEEDDLGRIIRENIREWQSGRYWRDKSVGECGRIRDVLTAAGRDVRDLRSRPETDQPPDCEGTINGQWCAIEDTELVHEPTMKRSIKAKRERSEGKDPKKPEAYFWWEQTSLLDALQQRITKKDEGAGRSKGGPYARYMLVMWTEETFLYRDVVQKFLEGACFRSTHITDAFLSLAYHPSADGQGGGEPLFELPLVKA
jgi:hypothetical protein